MRPGPAEGRVCFLISSFHPIVGGAERATEALGATIAERGEDVLVLTRRFPGLAASESISGMRVERKGLPIRGKFGALTYAVHTILSLAIRHRDYRIVHVQNPDTPLLVGFLARALLRRRLFVTVHSDPRVVLQGRGWSGGARLRWMDRLAEGVGALTDTMRAQLVALGIGEERLHVLPNGIDTETFCLPSADRRSAARSRLELADGVVTYVFVGRLVEVKRVDLLLEAWSNRPESGQRRTLVIVGDGPLRGALEAQRDRLGLADVRFEGRRSNIVDYLHAADVFVLPSDREGQSVALVEAMATGLTPVVSDVPGNCAMVDDGETGLIFPVGDADRLAAALVKAEDRDLRARVGAAAAEVGAANSLTRTGELHLALYGHLPSLPSPRD